MSIKALKWNFFILMIISGSLCFFLLSCNEKYDDDPFSMRFVDFDKRIVGTWNIEKILIDGSDSTKILLIDSLKIFSNYQFHKFEKDQSQSSQGHPYRLDLKTANGKTEAKLDYYPVIQGKKVKFLYFYSLEESYYTTEKIKTQGPINNFLPHNNLEWEILKLTKKEMHLSLRLNKKYDLVFKKS